MSKSQALLVDAHPSKRPSQARIHRLLLPCCLAYQGTLRRFTCDDLLRFNNINMDVLTETVSWLVNASGYLLRIENHSKRNRLILAHIPDRTP